MSYFILRNIKIPRKNVAVVRFERNMSNLLWGRECAMVIKTKLNLDYEIFPWHIKRRIHVVFKTEEFIFYSA